MNQFSNKTIHRAFEVFQHIFSQGWQLEHKNELYRSADRAFSNGGNEDEFEKVYNELIRTWGFGRKGQLISAFKAFSMLAGLPRHLGQRFKRKRLSTFTPTDIPDLAELLRIVAHVKKLKKDPSLMAISKLLHFWNPRFFVIFDQKIMENFVFEHEWLKTSFERYNKEVTKRIANERLTPRLSKAFSRYIATLWVCSDCLKSNPAIAECFFENCCQRIEQANPVRDLGNYEALAVEWFLEGAVHLPPCWP